MEYYFGEHLRWNLGWETPNQGGAFVATLLPWLWALSGLAWVGFWRAATGRARWVRGLVFAGAFVAEAAGAYALARTYSRGALVGVVIGALVWAGLAWRGRRPPEAGSGKASPERGRGATAGPRLLPWAARAALLAICLGVTGFHARVAPGHIAEDRSSINRLVLWRGGAELVAASPWQGWGWEKSGASFMHWTQPLDRTEGYLSMVNSYLTVAVEAGLPFFATVLAVLLLPLARLWVLGNAGASPSPGVLGGPWARACGASWAVWLACLFFSNLWIIAPLWGAPMLATLCLVIPSPHSRTTWIRVARDAAGASLVLALLLWLTGKVFAAQEPVRLRRDSGGMVTLTPNLDGRADPAQPVHGPRTERVLVLPDAEVLGENYGQELRRWLLADGRLAELRVVTLPARAPAAWEGVAGVVACGEACADPVLAASPAPVWLLHPTVAPPASVPSWTRGCWINLPGIDVGGRSPTWWEWATQDTTSIRARVTPGVADDVRSRWPDMALAAPWRAAP